MHSQLEVWRCLTSVECMGTHCSPVDFRTSEIWPCPLSCHLYQGVYVDKMIHLATIQAQSGHTFILTPHLMSLKAQM